MKRILVVLIPFVLLALSTICRDVSVASPPPQLKAMFSKIVPVIDGSLGSAEWNDTTRNVINLNSTTNVEAWLYIKHNVTHMHVGLLVWEVFTHEVDRFWIVFDEGDDGDHGSGTRDYVLRAPQEDIKGWDSAGVLFDGFYDGAAFSVSTSNIDFAANGTHENDHSTEDWEIEHWEGLTWVDDHWEVEFIIPLVGNDAGSLDVSDLSCTTTDTVGIKIYYYHFPLGNNYYYPSGSELQVNTYADLSFSPPPSIESCDSLGAKKDSFNLYEDVYANGSGFLFNATYDFYIVNDVEIWTDSMLIPIRVFGTATSITSDTDGTVLPVTVWSDPSTVGAYDMIVDVNKNGLYDEGIDALDNNDVQITAGFLIPEFAMLSGLLLFQLAVFIVMVFAKKHNL